MSTPPSPGLPHAFSGSIPPVYDRHLGPVLFVPWADELVQRWRPRAKARVLEVACGTGIVTSRLLARLPADGQLVATDLNPAMLDHARQQVVADRRLQWQPVDAQQLPFPDASFDHYLCQFGVMFFPDKVAALKEARRVLAPGGEILLNTWGPLAANDFARIGHTVTGRFFPSDPPTFYLTPFGWHDEATIRAAFAAAGFPAVTIEARELATTAVSAVHLATGVVRGNPISVAIQERLGDVHDRIIAAVAHELAQIGGDAPWRGTLRALVVRATR